MIYSKKNLIILKKVCVWMWLALKIMIHMKIQYSVFHVIIISFLMVMMVKQYEDRKERLLEILIMIVHYHRKVSSVAHWKFHNSFSAKIFNKLYARTPYGKYSNEHHSNIFKPWKVWRSFPLIFINLAT